MSSLLSTLTHYEEQGQTVLLLRGPSELNVTGHQLNAKCTSRHMPDALNRYDSDETLTLARRMA